MIEYLREGKNIALVSDAGTPCISDPGFRVLREAIDEGFSVESVPGVSALTGALSICGLPTDRFVFEGFLDGRRKRRQNQLIHLREEERRLVLFESPHRLLVCLGDIHSIFGSRRICVVREMTKKFEEVIRGHISAVLEILQSRSTIKGKITLIIILYTALMSSIIIPWPIQHRRIIIQETQQIHPYGICSTIIMMILRNTMKKSMRKNMGISGM